MELVDLHAHTTASDGSLSPAELVDLARKINLAAVAVTDHDTVDGLDEALKRAHETGFEVVPGIEISAEFSGGAMHMLGYFVDHHEPVFSARVRELQDFRNNRNPAIVAKLNSLGFDMTMDEVRAAAGGGQVGRPHFAKVMLAKGFVGQTQEAFDKYLAKGGPAYVDKKRFSPADSIALIRGAGGVPVLGHPKTLNRSPQELDHLVGELAEAGLGGIEVYYSEHTSAQSKLYMKLAQKYNLAPTGGSDYHGASKPNIHLGRGFGNLRVTYEILTGLKQKKEALS